MRILVITPEQLPVPPIKGGSVETCTYNVFRAMARTDQITFLSLAHPKLPLTSSMQGGNLVIYRIPQRNRELYIKEALRRVRGKKFHIIQIENRPTFVPFVRKAFPRTPIVLSLHSLTFMSQLSRDRAHSILRQVNRVTSVVDFVSRTMRKRYPAFAQKFKTAILGVDINKFKPLAYSEKAKLRKAWGVDNTYNLLFVGRIIKRKGLHTLIKTASLLKHKYSDIAIVAVGASWPGETRETAYMKEVRLLSKNLKIPLYFTGYVPPAKVHQMYHLGHIFVCPTQFQEGFATVNSEAMASGLPVVASKRGGIVEVIKDGQSGLLVSDYLNPAAFAKAILSIIQSPALAKKLAAGGRERMVKEFSWLKTANRLKSIYRQVI